MSSKLDAWLNKQKKLDDFLDIANGHAKAIAVIETLKAALETPELLCVDHGEACKMKALAIDPEEL